MKTTKAICSIYIAPSTTPRPFYRGIINKKPRAQEQKPINRSQNNKRKSLQTKIVRRERSQTSAKDNSRLFYDAQLCNRNHFLYVCFICISIGVIVVLHCLLFYLLTFATYWILKHMTLLSAEFRQRTFAKRKL